jgi:hypothetical protein
MYGDRYGIVASIAALVLSTGGVARADEASRSLSVLAPTRVYQANGGEDWKALSGFGKEADHAEMMILMMVGGSGMEGMKMASMKSGRAMGGMASAPMKDHPHPGASGGLTLKVTPSPDPPAVGESKLVLLVTDSSGHPVKGLKIGAAVAMTSMDMGTDRPKVTDRGNGQYEMSARFSMKGPWRLTLTMTPPGGKAFSQSFDFNVSGE